MVVVCLVVLFSPRAPGTGGIIGLDKLVHASLFAALAASTRWRFGRGLPWVVAFAPVSEVLQMALPISRDGDPFDVLADTTGALLCWALLSARRPLALAGEPRDPSGRAR